MNTPEPPKDKRTKEFKAWKEKYEAAPEGLGSVVESITTATGIKAAVEAVAEAFDASCGCEERKVKLNNILRFKPKDCFTEEEFNFLSDYYSEDLGAFRENVEITPPEQDKFLKIYNRIMPRTRSLTNCGSCFRNDLYRPLSTIYSTYL